jgi:Family of unknown function (DUF5681)
MTQQFNTSANEGEFIDQPSACRTTEEYKVGYGKPPKSSRFKKGRSGNSKGRPRTKPSAKRSFDEVFARKVPATVSGKKQYLDGMQALFLLLRSQASKGDLKAARLVFDFCKLFGGANDPGKGNEELKGLFDALMAGPVDTPGYDKS